MVYSYSFGHGFSAAVGCACCCRRDTVGASSSSGFKEEPGTSDKIGCKRRLLVFVNPRSGAGKSAHVFSKQVIPKLSGSGIEYDLVLTERPLHAKAYIASVEDFHDYDAILIVSGDGLVFEIVNALLERQDNPFIPIGIVPTGSGNGLLSSVFYHHRLSLKKSEFLKRAIGNVCNPDATTCPVNLMHVETPTKSYAAFISVGFGLFADIDIESEKWRKTLESARFTAGALVRLFSLRTYRCKLSYCQNDEGDDAASTAFPEPSRVYPKVSCAGDFSIESKQPTLLDELESNNTILSDCLRRSYFQKGVPKVTEPVPADWTVIDDEFLFIYALTISHAGQDIPYVPDADLCDRNIYLTYALKKDLHSRLDLLNFLSDIKHAKHLKYPFLRVVPVKAFRFEKTEQPSVGGYISVDGEVIDCDVLQATNTFSTISVIGV